MWRRFFPNKIHAPALNSYEVPLNTIRSLEEAAVFIERLKAQPIPVEDRQKQTYYKSLLLAQTPRAALAQVEMDKHKHGYRNREKRLYELIDFNDSLVSSVLATPHAGLPGMADSLKVDMTKFCRRLGTPMFSDTQFDAIVRGLAREIAVYRGALHQGYKARMTSRTEDAFGIDMVIIQPHTGKQLNIDCKTPSAFRHRLEDLVLYGKISDEQLIRADEVDFLTHIQHRGEEDVPVTLLCVRPETLGEITDFTFSDTVPLRRLLDRIFETIQ